MEKFNLKQRLGKGAQGSVFLVIEKTSGEQYVLKKVECTDEQEANKAFKEVMALQDLKHSYICGYKEFFVTWDKEESAMFVCIVMDYYPMGDLDRLLKQKREKKEKIEELVLKKWFGQMLEALVFVHKKQVIHRDLKPSNIFLTKDLNVSIGDFGVATVMGDARTRTRTTVGSMNWMAPEVLERPYDERSDVWSLGCIMLEMATCGFMNSQSIAGVLFEIKQSPTELEETLKQVGKDYSVDMCQLIRTMLRRSFQERPSAVEMVDLPYVKECLALSNSALVGKKKEKQMNAKTVPKGATEAAVVAFMKENADNEISITNAISHLNSMKVTKLEDATKKFVIQLMRTHMSEKPLQIEASRLLLTVAAAADVEEDADDYIFSGEVISVVCLGMKSHVSSKELQSINSLLLKTIALNENAAGLIGDLGGVQDILSTMRAFPEDPEVSGNCCSALSCLTINDKNLAIMREEKGVIDLMKAMETHEKEASVIDFACSALWGLSLEDENVEMMAERKAAEVLLNAIVLHIKNPDVVKNASMALGSLVGESEESAFAALNNDGGKSGIVIVQEAYQHHKDNPDVVENICTFFMEMSEYEDIVQDLSNSKVRDLLKDVKVKYASNEDIMGPVQTIEAKLG